MTMRVRARGRASFLSAITDKIKTLHLFTATGELEGRDYEPITLDPALWVGGVYPPVEWRLPGDRDNQETVLGYFASDAEGVLLDEPFDEPFELADRDARIGVTVRLLLLGAE